MLDSIFSPDLIATIIELSGHIQDPKTLIALVVIAAVYKLVNKLIIAKAPIKSNTVGQIVSSGLDMIPAVPLIKNVVGLFQKLLK